MKIFDFNVHPGCNHEHVDARILTENNLNHRDHLNEIKYILNRPGLDVKGFNYMIFNSSLWRSLDVVSSIDSYLNASLDCH